MKLRFKKSSAGVTLTCLRDDGTVAVQRTAHGEFFAMHDLLHYAVESALGLRCGFLGLMAAGWEFENFTRRDDPKYRELPDEALVAEHLVNLLSQRRRDLASPNADVRALLADEASSYLRTEADRAGRSARFITADEIASIDRMFTDLMKRWSAIPAGEHLELLFPPEAT